MTGIILPRRERDKLGILHDEFLKGDIEGFVVIAVANDGTVNVHFDLHDSMTMPGLNKIGGGLSAAMQHVRELALQLHAEQQLEIAEAAKAAVRH